LVIRRRHISPVLQVVITPRILQDPAVALCFGGRGDRFFGTELVYVRHFVYHYTKQQMVSHPGIICSEDYMPRPQGPAYLGTGSRKRYKEYLSLVLRIPDRTMI